MDPTTTHTHDGRPGASLAAEITTEMVRLLSEYTGRGPTRARTYLHDDLVSVVLRDSLTKAERCLVDTGNGEHVRHSRSLFQDAMRSDIVSIIERLTGRRVVAFLSDNHIDPDIAVESLLLEPSTDGP